MNPADINTTERSLVCRAATQSGKIQWHMLSKCIVCRMPSLFDETGIVFSTATGELYVRETQPGYAELFAALKIDQHLPDEWYSAVESGESFQVDLVAVAGSQK